MHRENNISSSPSNPKTPVDRGDTVKTSDDDESDEKVATSPLEDSTQNAESHESVKEVHSINQETVQDVEFPEGENITNGNQDYNKTNNSDSNDDADRRTDDNESLNAVYGNRIGIIQSLSLLLNAGLMVYAHVGVSALILSNQQRVEDQKAASSTESSTTNNDTMTNNSTSAACNEYDMDIWYNQGGLQYRSTRNNYCSREYVGPNSNGQVCLVTPSCNAECFEYHFNYSYECSQCLSIVPQCGLKNGCAGSCGLDYLSEECLTCTSQCTIDLSQCTGFTTDLPANSTLPPTNEVTKKNNTNDNDNNEVYLTNEEICANQLEGVNWDSVIDRSDFNVVYTLTFVHAIKDAWNGNAKIMAFVIVLFSGVWPYLKNIILMFAWYLKLSSKTRGSILTWLKRLGKYTLVDIYAVVVIMVGVQIQANIADVPVIVTAEPRPAIIAFLIATLWEFVHFEWMTQLHHDHYHNHHNKASDSNSSDDIVNGDATKNHADEEDHGLSNNCAEFDKSSEVNILSHERTLILQKLRFENFEKNELSGERDTLVCKSQLCLRIFVLVMILGVLALLLAGSVVECLSFTTYVGDNTIQGCQKSYNLYTLGSAMIQDNFLDGNSAPFGTWFMYLCYIFLVGFAPLFVIATHMYIMGLQQQQKISPILCRAADVIWSFASIEILLLAIMLVQYKFDDLIAALAGNENSAFFVMSSALGTGFYILIGYSVLAGILQYIFNSAVSEYYHVDPFHKIDYWWTPMLRCFLRDEK